jgi:hypothetical protein
MCTSARGLVLFLLPEANGHVHFGQRPGALLFLHFGQRPGALFVFALRPEAWCSFFCLRLIAVANVPQNLLGNSEWSSLTSSPNFR